MTLSIKWLGHASFQINAEGKTIYIDPYEGEYSEEADLILVSHSHSDHCDTSKINKYGFLPRVGHTVTIVGLKTPSKDGIHDFSMSHVSELIHRQRNKKNITK